MLWFFCYICSLNHRVNMALLTNCEAMHPKQKHNELGQFTTVGNVPMSKKVTGVRLPQDVTDALDQLPSEKRVDFLRKVISDAVREKLIQQ